MMRQLPIADLLIATPLGWTGTMFAPVRDADFIAEDQDSAEITRSSVTLGVSRSPISSLQQIRGRRWGPIGWLTLNNACGLMAAVISLSAEAGRIEGINHTNLSINRFSVNGQAGLDIIGPYQWGSGGCCYTAPKNWEPGMTARVDWQTGAAAGSKLSREFPGFADETKYLAWRAQVMAQKRQHSKVVPVPDYTGQKVCGITVHFLPCDEIAITTSCYGYGNPNYPITTPLQLSEPQSCPQ